MVACLADRMKYLLPMIAFTGLVFAAPQNTTKTQQLKVSQYRYDLENGITVKVEKGWGYVSAQQHTSPGDDGVDPFGVSVEPVGNSAASAEIEIYAKNGKKVSPADVTAGSYYLNIVCDVAGGGKIRFRVDGIQIREKTQNRITVALYQIGVSVTERAIPHKGLAHYESRVSRFSGNPEQNLNWGLPAFYKKGNHKKKIPPAEAMTDYSGRLKPGKYDVLISVEIGHTGFTNKVWLEGIEFAADKSYQITTNLNAGEVVYVGGKTEVKALHLYPRGSAGRQTGTAKREKKSEILTYEAVTHVQACPPGVYDVLLDYGNGQKYEWLPGIKILSGNRTGIR